MPPNAKRSSAAYQVSAATPVTMVTHFVAIAVGTLVLVWVLNFRDGVAFKSDRKMMILNLHAVLMVIGFLLVSGEAIMAFTTLPVKRKVQKAVHYILQLIALVAGVVGVYVAFKFKHESRAKDMTSLHSWLGMIAICLFGLQWVLGFFSFVFPRAKMPARASYKPWHIFGGMFIFVVGIGAAELGLLQRSNGLGTSREGLIVNFTGLLLVLFAAGAGLSIFLPNRYSY